MESSKDQTVTFSYTYSAQENAQVQEIRKKYLPQTESKLDELKRLDDLVQSSGVAEALCTGLGGTLVFGIGLCLCMQVIGSGVLAVALGVFLGMAGIAGILAAYPMYRRAFEKSKEKYRDRILELAAELSAQ